MQWRRLVVRLLIIRNIHYILVFMTILLNGCGDDVAIDQEKFKMSILNQKPVFTINFQIIERHSR